MSRGRCSGDRWGRGKLFLGLMGIAFAVTMALVVATRLNSESLAVLAGAVVGAGAAIPTSLLIASVSSHRDRPRRVHVRQQAPAPARQQGAYPPVVVVAPPVGQPYPGSWGRLPLSLAAPSQRSFTVVGGDLEETEVLDDERYR